MVKQLGSSRELLKVGAERKELSFVFTDLEGFTTLVESNSPSLIMPILNGYLEELTEVAFRHDGTLDKIVGDALHVIFGAPMTQVNHAERAMACALEIDRVAEGYRKKVSSSVTLGITRIGVNTGYAVVGNFGSDDYFDYTAHGDAINIAARLEGANKYLLTRICVSQGTVAQLEKFDGRSIGTMMLVGKKSGVQVFDATPVDNKAQQDLEAYSEAWFAMASGHSNALEMFSAYCQMYPQDGLAAFHLGRLQQGKYGVTIYLDGK
jgi:adenylate cyclase